MKDHQYRRSVGVGRTGNAAGVPHPAATCAVELGHDVKVSEVHGMSQRGGSVVTYVRYGRQSLFALDLEAGEADVIMLALKCWKRCALSDLSERTAAPLIVEHPADPDPLPVIIGAAKYPG